MSNRIQPFIYSHLVAPLGHVRLEKSIEPVKRDSLYPFDLLLVKELATKPSQKTSVKNVLSTFIDFFSKKDETCIPSLEEFSNPATFQTESEYTYQHPYSFWQPTPFIAPPPIENLIREQPKEKWEEEKALEKTLLELRRKPIKGRLMQDRKGYVYLKVADKLLRSLISPLVNTGATLPPYFHTIQSLGAHIGVILPSELKSTVNIEEIGEEFYFSISAAFRGNPSSWQEMEQVWYLTVIAPSLTAIREKYGLTEKIFGHEFAMVIATKKEVPEPETSLISSELLAVGGHCRIGPACQRA